jgi:predicted component of type VI protein secretion system
MTSTAIGNVASKVLWGEGLLLRPQHFQRQDPYHEHRLCKSIRAVHPYAWGVEALRIERDALASNILRVLSLARRFQDGEWVDAPGADELPDTVPVRPDTCYFILDAKGQMYERMQQAQSMAIYVPSGMKGLKLELLAVAA